MAVSLEGNALTLSGVVGDFSAWDDSGFSYAEVLLRLAQVEDSAPLTVYLNSGGGDAFEGAAIHALLFRREGGVNVVIDGIAASAASLIAMAGETITVSPGAVMMIHDPAMVTIGTAADHAGTVKALDELGTSYARVYAARSGKTADECRSIMRAERWFSPDEAIAEGFATALAERRTGAVAAFDYGLYANAPNTLKAMASEKGWRQPDATKGRSAPDRQPKETSMTDTKADDPAVNIETAKADAAKAAQQRIEAVLASDEAKDRRELAEHLAFRTDMSADQAKAALAAAPKSAAPTMDAEGLLSAAYGDPAPSSQRDASQTGGTTAKSNWGAVASNINGRN